MTTRFRPMRASLLDPEKMAAIAYPKIAQPKYDGFRCILGEDGARTKTLKPVPNRHIYETLGALDFKGGYDGEIVTFTDGQIDPLDVVQSKVTRQEGRPDFCVYVFDCFDEPARPYTQRVAAIELPDSPHLAPVPSTVVNSAEELVQYEADLLKDDWEGVMIRCPESPYKFGQSTLREEWLLKLKRFLDDEAVVVGFEERLKNTNAAKTDEVGYAKRSSAKAGKVPAGDMGSLQCEWQGVRFDLGVPADRRADLWEERHNLIGAKVTFQYQRKGPNGKPLLPTFKTIRPEIDII